MSSLAKFTSDASIKAETDSLGSSFKVLPSKIYAAKIKVAYIQKAKESEAMGIVLVTDIAGSEYKETLWISGREGNNFYVDKNSGEKKFLGGFLLAESICLLAAKKPLASIDTEIKTLRLYNADAKADVPTKVEVLVDLIGAEVQLGIIQQTTFKQAKDAKGKWADTDETRDENVIDKAFRASDSKTTAEIRGKAETAEFHTLWTEKWEGQVKDRTKGKKGKAKAAGVAGAPKAPVTSDLFAD